MHQIIHNFKLRLTNLSQGNRSLKLGRLSSRRDIDLKMLAYLEKESAEEILAKIIADKDVRLIKQIDPRHEPTNIADRRLNNIFREVNTIFEETGTYDLYVGYPFVEGKFIDGTIARCPVLLFPVRLIRNLQQRPRWKLERIKDEPVEFNKTFFLAYEQFQQLRIKAEFWEEEIEPHKDWREWVNQLYQKIKAYDIQINFNARLFDLKLNHFVDYLSSSMERFPLGQLKFQPDAVLGIFPQSDSALLQDYQEIEKNLDKYELGHIFFSEEEKDSPLASTPKEDYIREEHRFFVTPVDDSQEHALLDIKQGKSLVIHGPPGTGKSQLIVNIIADAMAHGKKVLLVSQKRAALDVVYKRLNGLGLSQFAVLLHDYRHDRKSIYRKIKQQIDNIDHYKREINDLNITKWEHDYKLLSRQADQYHRQFTELYEALTTPRDCGLSIHQLYLQTHTDAEILPLEAVAKDLDEAKLERMIDKLRIVLDYADFFAEEYPWKQRLSFRHYSHDDKYHLSQKLKALPLQIEELKALYVKLLKDFDKNIQEPAVNSERIATFRNIDQQLSTAAILKDVEAIYADELKPSFIKKKFEQIGNILEEMEQLDILKAFSWSLYGSLHEHINEYKQKQGKLSSYLSIKFLRARWFLLKILKGKGLKLSEDHLKTLYKEYRLFSRLHGHYVRIHEKLFFSDFPLLENLSSKQKWLLEKQTNVETFFLIHKLNFFKTLAPSFIFGKLDGEKWKNSLKKIDKLEHFSRKLGDAQRVWRHFLHHTQIEQLKKGIAGKEAAQAFIDQLSLSFQDNFADLQQLDRALADCEAKELKAIELLESHIASTKDPESLVAQVRNSIYFYWIEHIERQHPILADVSTRGWSRKRKDFALKLALRRTKVTELIQRKLKEKIVGIIQYNRLRNPITFRKIYHQVSKKRRLWPVRKLIKESWRTGLQELVPCWMASPESVAAIFPMQKDFFDIVIFDEASQCFVERAIPVILRAKQCVVAGDDQQLQPLNLYTVRYDEAEAAFSDDIALEVESILDLAKTSFEERKLNWHYRSEEEELINFSNQAFYEGKLQVIPPAKHNALNFPPLEWVGVAGEWQANQNIPEAKCVVKLILKLVQREDQPSIGVVTFNYHQKELIKDLLDNELEYLAQNDEQQYTRLQAAMHQTENKEFVGIFVKNIENVQGDERDIIIFSVGYGYNSAGKLNTNFGLLNQKGGENRLNVAISRARQKIFVLCSFNPADLKVEKSINEGPKYFKSYLQYVKYMSEGRMTDAFNLLNQQREKALSPAGENPIADYIAQALTAKGFHCIRNLGDTSYQLDLAVKASAEAQEFLLGIECEGSQYFSGNSSKEREVYRRNLLESRNWKIHRVWARNFWLNRAGEVAEVLKLLETD